MTRNRTLIPPVGARLQLLCLLVLVLSGCTNSSLETKDNFDWVELPDGSTVFLNHNSTIRYDKKFSPRTINLEGEAFFSVALAETPFMITSRYGKIIVTGTEFDVRATEDELVIEVEEGTVEVEAKDQPPTKLKRGDRAVYNSNKRAVQVEKAEYEFRLWMSELEVEFKKLGKEVKRTSKEIGKESKKAAKELKKELKKLKIN